MFGTPHNLDLVKLAQGFGASVSKVSNLAELQSAIAKPLVGLDIVIVQTPNRERNAEQLAELTHKVSNAVRIGINLA